MNLLPIECTTRSTYEKKVIDLCKEYNIMPTFDNVEGDATGIGDILFRILCIKNKLITNPFVINLTYFTQPYYGACPINQLEFRLKLIMELIKCNSIEPTMIKFVFSSNMNISQYFPWDSINNFKLLLDNNDTKTLHEEYIIFHTKLRHIKAENYTLIKNQLQFFCKNFKTKYKILLMGERTFPNTEETEIHGITTAYNELLELKIHNDVSDITVENIYNNLDYNNYKNDIELIKNAKHNVCSGVGGQLCTSLIFGNSVIFYDKYTSKLKNNHLNDNNHYRFDDFSKFLNEIYKKCT